MKNFYIYLLVMAGVTYLIRMLPLVLVKKKIKNKYLLSFLYYIPYTVLAAMTFPAAVLATGNMLAASLGLIAGGVLALQGKGLTLVAFVCCAVSLMTDLIMITLN